jgi:prepilin-type N-terminal cleavage/methylation domain-containing protein
MESFHIRGFTLVELLVVLAIITTLSGIVLSSQSTFNKTLVLSNTAYDIALTLRSAETYGLSSRASGSTANAGYGAHFQIATPGSFVFFADTSPAVSCETPDCKPGDHFYSGADTLVQTYVLGNNIKISDFCAQNVSWSCASTGALSSLDIVFARPNPEAYITSGGSSYTKACLVIWSPQGDTEKYVSINSSGQIIANAASCGP